MILWGAGMGAHDSVMRAAIADWISPQKRSGAYGLFNSIYGIAWFIGSASMGFLYDHSINSLVIFSVICEVLAIPLIWATYRLAENGKP
jgi:MFS family permease